MENEKKGSDTGIRVISALVVIAIAIGLAMYFVNRNGAAVSRGTASRTEMRPKGAPATGNTAAGNTATPAVGNMETKTIDIEAGSFYYKPNAITVPKGTTVKIVMHTVSMAHNFNIDELGVHMPIVRNGETGTVEFTADKTGKYEFYCSVANHRQMGQIGTLTVE